VTVKGVVSVNDAKETVTKQVKLQAYNKAGKEVDFTITPSVVDVEVPITSPLKQIPLQIKLSGEPAPGFAVDRVNQSIEKITVFGEQSILDGLEFYEGPVVDIRGLTDSKEYTLEIPLKYKLTKIDPVKVTVRVIVVPSVAKTLEGVAISPIGQSDATVTNIIVPDTGKLTLQVEGSPERINKLTSADVQALVNVTNLAPGMHELAIAYNLPPFIKVVQPTDAKATVEITAKATGDGSIPSNGSGGGATGTGEGGNTGTGGSTTTPGASPSPSASPNNGTDGQGGSGNNSGT